jgi:hypothetical protein
MRLAGMTQKSYLLMQNLWKNKLDLPTEFILFRRITLMSQLEPEIYDCCKNSCIAFVGSFEDMESCPVCRHARRTAQGKPYSQYWYLPLIPWIQSLYANKDMVLALKYRQKYVSRQHEQPDIIADIYDSKHYMSLIHQNVVIEGKEYEHKYFQNSTDLCFGHSMDGVSLFKRRKSSSSATPAFISNWMFA